MWAGLGGMVDEGSGDVKAKRRAAAKASEWMLNSARGVIYSCYIVSICFAYRFYVQESAVNVELLTFPGASTAPPMTTTSFALKNVSGSSAAANAKFVIGPTATIVTVSGSFSLSVFRI